MPDPSCLDLISALARLHPKSRKQVAWALTCAAQDYCTTHRRPPEAWEGIPASELTSPEFTAAHLARAQAGSLSTTGHTESPRTTATRAWVLRLAARSLGTSLPRPGIGYTRAAVTPEVVRWMLRAAASITYSRRLRDPRPVRAALALHLAAVGLETSQMCSLTWADVHDGTVPTPLGRSAHLGPVGRSVLDQWLDLRADLVANLEGSADRLLVTLRPYPTATGARPPGVPAGAQAIARGHRQLVDHLTRQTRAALPQQLQQVATAARTIHTPITA